MGKQLALFDNIVMHNVIIEVISSAELFNGKTLSTLIKAKCGLNSTQCERSSRLFVRLSPPNFSTDLSICWQVCGDRSFDNISYTYNETELYYLQSRYYDPEVCRFINCDDVNYIGVDGIRSKL